MLPSQYARIINRALANPNSGISLAPAHTEKPTPNLATHTTRGKARSFLATHTTRGKARSFLAVHPGRAFYSAKEATAILSVSQATLVRLAKKHNLTKFKRNIFIRNTNQTHIQAFYLKTEINALAKHRRNEK